MNVLGTVEWDDLTPEGMGVVSFPNPLGPHCPRCEHGAYIIGTLLEGDDKECAELGVRCAVETEDGYWIVKNEPEI